MKKLIVIVIIIMVLVLSIALIRSPVGPNDMLPIYSAMVSVKQGDSSAIVTAANAIAKKHSLQMAKNDLSRSNSKVVTIELSNNDVSIMLASYSSNNVYKLAIRVPEERSEKDEYLLTLFESIEREFKQYENIELERTEVKVYNTIPDK